MMSHLTVAKKGEHSSKPEVFADGITKMFPTTYKLEMFARRTNHAGDNWHYWGNEVGQQLEKTKAVEKPKPKRNGKPNGKRAETKEQPKDEGESIRSGTGTDSGADVDTESVLSE
jgi:hypothetical protein